MLENMLNKKFALPILLILILAIFCIDVKFIFKPMANKNNCTKGYIKIAEANKDQIFKISKIIQYSSAEAVDNTVEQNLQDVTIHQYSDIAIYIDNSSTELNEQNTIKELYLDNFAIDVDYNYGTPTLYYKNPLEISKFRMMDENEITDRLDYKIIYTNEDNDESKYDSPVFFTDCSNPITIGYINKNIVNNYEVTKENGLVSFDGRIFENLDINLSKLSPKISFTIHLKNNLDENFVCDMSAKLRLETEEGTVKSGYIVEILDNIEYYKFFKQI